VRHRVQLRGLLLASLLTALTAAVGCGDRGSEGPEGTEITDPSGDGERTHGLTEADAALVLATVGDREITLGQFAAELDRGALLRTRYRSPERRRELLDQMIRFELLAQEAARRGYDQLPEVQRARKQILIRRFLRERFDAEGEESIPQEDVEAYFEAHRSDYEAPAQRRASILVVRERRLAQRLLRELEDDADGQRFRELVREHSVDEVTAARFGDLGFFSRRGERRPTEPEVADGIRDVAFEELQEIGQVHDEVLRTDAGYAIVRLTGRREAMRRTLESVSQPIRNRLWRERREQAIEDLIERLRGESDVEIDMAALDDVRVDVPEQPPPPTNPLRPTVDAPQ
jgi:peptidyl-prolyl cis-trans isomerase C